MVSENLDLMFSLARPSPLTCLLLMELATQHTEPPADTRADEIERLTQAYGREIFGRLERAGPLLFTPSWWDERLMEW